MESKIKRVRVLLRVSSDQQLEADGDLGVQRKIVSEYIAKHQDWQLDSRNILKEVTVDIKIL